MIIGWIGTGIMGRWMCEHLLKQNHKMLVYNRTPSKCDPLVKLGAEFTEPEIIAKESEVVFIMLGYPHDVEDVVLGKNGLLKNMKPGTVLVDHTTSRPELAKRIYSSGLYEGVVCFDAPVSGGDIRAKSGELISMVGGPKKYFDKILPLLSAYSQQVTYMGEAGVGQHTKMCNQIMISTTMMGVAEAFLYGYKAGVPLQQLVELLQNGGAGSYSLKYLGPKMLNRDFAPGFLVHHFFKDLGIALEEARRMNLNLPGLTLGHSLYGIMMQHKGDFDGSHGLLKVMELLNNFELPNHCL